MGTKNSATGGITTLSGSGDGYLSLNERIWSQNGGGYDAALEQSRLEKKKRQQNPGYATAYGKNELQQAMNNAGVTAEQYSERVTPQGDSGADEALLDENGYAYVQYCKEQYQNATSQEERDHWHEEAERVRAGSGYSGGSDGSLYLTLGQTGGRSYGDELPSRNSTRSDNDTQTNMKQLRSMLAAWKQSAQEQYDAQIDYAVQNAVSQLQQTLEDSQTQLKEQAESVAHEEQQSLDNSALYAELRGDRGGIGREQYDSIQNTAANQQLSVQLTQTKITSDIAQQIEELRKEGEFQKADIALEMTQCYLEKLFEFEQWAAENQISDEKFQSSLDQWQQEYDLSMLQLDLPQKQSEQNLDYYMLNTSKDELLGFGNALASSGIALSAKQRVVMGITPKQETTLLWQNQLSTSQA